MDFLFVVALVFAMFFDKNNAVIVGVVASICHECGHLIAMHFCKEVCTDLKIGLGRVDILRDGKTFKSSFEKEILILISGPAFNFFAAGISVFCKHFLCEFGVYKLFLAANIAMGVVNLLPVYFLDGGQILYLVLDNFYSEEFAKAILNMTSIAFLVILSICAIIFIYLSGYNFSLLVLVIYLFLYYILKN